MTLLGLALAFGVHAQDKKVLVMLHTNDTHSTVVPVNKNLEDTLISGRGGFLRRATVVEQERAKHPDLPVARPSSLRQRRLLTRLTLLYYVQRRGGGRSDERHAI